MSDTAVIDVRDFRMRFGEQVVIDDLSFEVRPGETFGLLGSNGSGKTTTIRALLGIYTPTAGTLLVEGRRFDPAQGSRLGYLPEERGLYRKESVLDVMTYFGQLKGQTRDAASGWSREYLGRVGLADHAKVRVDKLSGGQQQKVQLGVTIMNSPSILILDEPTKGFDPVNRRLLMDLVDEQRQQGSTVVMVTHQMDEVERLCDRILLLKDGRAEAYGTVGEVQDAFGGRRLRLTFSGTLPQSPNYRVEVSERNYAELELPEGTELGVGAQAVCELARRDDVDCVLVAIVGAAGLEASHAALTSNKRLALANKESLVVGGDLLMPLAQPGQLIPVDSEHSAIYQCYLGENPREAHCIWLTCSGGPFFGRTRDELDRVTRADALAHPTWAMGAKITIDSATLMNKGLERIEAMHLFNCDLDFINVVVQRQSKIHSMVEFADGSVMAHLGASDMRIPIQFAFSYPERWDTPAPRIDFRELGQLTFDAADMDTFRCLALAERAGKTGGTMPCVLNAANEVAVDAFLHDGCSFTDIDRIVESCMDAHDMQAVDSFEQLRDIDAWAREKAAQVLAATRS